MGNWIDALPKPKSPQTWVGVLMASASEEEKFREIIENSERPITVTLTRRTDEQFYATVEYGPVIGANKTDVSRMFKDIETYWDLMHTGTRK